MRGFMWRYTLATGIIGAVTIVAGYFSQKVQFTVHKYKAKVEAVLEFRNRHAEPVVLCRQFVPQNASIFQVRDCFNTNTNTRTIHTHTQTQAHTHTHTSTNTYHIILSSRPAQFSSLVFFYIE